MKGDQAEQPEAAPQDPFAAHARDPSDPTDFAHLSRSYDDEDAAFQAALRASMEDVPAGWVAPELHEKPIQRTTSATAQRAPLPQPPETKPAQVPKAKNWHPAEPAPVPGPVPVPPPAQPAVEDGAEPEEILSADEIRRRRLAKFG